MLSDVTYAKLGRKLGTGYQYGFLNVLTSSAVRIFTLSSEELETSGAAGALIFVSFLSKKKKKKKKNPSKVSHMKL